MTVRLIRSAAAHVAGVSVVNVMKTADWTRESTFRRFYHKPIQVTEFGHTVFLEYAFIGFEHTLSCMQPYHDIELKISQGSEGPDVRLEFY